MLVLPIDVVGSIPTVGSLIKGMLYVGGTVPGVLQGSGDIPLVIDDIHTHDVTVTETSVVHTRQCQLVNLSCQGNRHSFCLSRQDRLFLAGGQPAQQGKTENPHIMINDVLHCLYSFCSSDVHSATPPWSTPSSSQPPMPTLIPLLVLLTVMVKVWR